jgi:hypothetical protein
MLSPKIDAYIQSAPEEAKPILEKIRGLFHAACPAIEETMKWSVPHFDYKGVLAGVSAHKKHVNLVFWKTSTTRRSKGYPNSFEHQPTRTSLKSRSNGRANCSPDS